MRNRRTILIVALVVVIIGVTIATAYVFFARGPQSTTTLPSYCSKPPGAFLIVAGPNGYNDSVDHGVPSNPWPVVNVQKGANVTIVVCNVDQQAHGFQVQHYMDSPVHVVAPGQVVTFTFVADETGTFQIYCSIFCTVHWAMQSGQLRVS
jgi:heme/copper-type cytochrome/quinol oxidase subunit 2